LIGQHDPTQPFSARPPSFPTSRREGLLLALLPEGKITRCLSCPLHLLLPVDTLAGPQQVPSGPLRTLRLSCPLLHLLPVDTLAGPSSLAHPQALLSSPPPPLSTLSDSGPLSLLSLAHLSRSSSLAHPQALLSSTSPVDTTSARTGCWVLEGVGRKKGCWRGVGVGEQLGKRKIVTIELECNLHMNSPKTELITPLQSLS
jgi:hypothetical protein